MSDYDVIVIGGGAAGLAGATALARARRHVLVIDAGEPRNAPAEGVHVFLSRDGVPPATLLADARRDLAAYGAEVRSGEVVGVSGALDAFEVRLADGTTLTARRLLVTTGLVDELPEVEGLAERWGRSVLHCPYCHGWEVRDQAIVVLGTGPLAGHAALLWSQWSDRVTLVLHDLDEVPAEQAALVAARGVRVLPGRVERIVGEGTSTEGVVVDGEVVPCDAVVAPAFARSRGAVLVDLGLEATPFEIPGGHVVATRVETDEAGQTAVPGVYAAGNVAKPQAQVITAAADATWAGAQINMSLLMADAQAAAAAAS